MKITPKLIRRLCIEQKGYTTPALNEVLYLHYKGFEKIEALDDYTGLKTLWLEGNSITTIENLDHLKDLRCLYLQENGIEIVSGLDELTQLAQLNLSDNMISDIPHDAFAALPQLESLQLCRNRLKTAASIAAVAESPGLTSLDLTGNGLDDITVLEDVFARMAGLRVLILTGNDIIKTMSAVAPYRFTMIASLPGLTYLDDKPVFDDERQAVDAWREAGGLRLYKERNSLSPDEKAEIKSAAAAAMRAKREALRVAKETAHRESMEAFEDMVRAARVAKGLPTDIGGVMSNGDDDEEEEDMPALEEEGVVDEPVVEEEPEVQATEEAVVDTKDETFLTTGVADVQVTEEPAKETGGDDDFDVDELD